MRTLPEREIMPDPNNCFHVRRNDFGAATCRVSNGRPVDMSVHRAVGNGDAGARPCEFVATGFCVADGTGFPPVAADADANTIYEVLEGYLPSATYPHPPEEVE